MLLARQLYWLTVGLTLLFFFLFIRLFVWKIKADRDHWSKRPQLTRTTLERLAQQKRRLLPYITLMIPARNEAEVIGRTIEHLCQINYPPDRYEIIIVSDEKEEQASDLTRAALLQEIKKNLRQGSLRIKPCFQIQGFTRILTLFLVQTLINNPQTLPSLPESLQSKKRLVAREGLQSILVQLCEAPKAKSGHAEMLLERYFPDETEKARQEMLPVLLNLAFVVRQVLFRLTEPSHDALRTRLLETLKHAPALTRMDLRYWFEIRQAQLHQALLEFWRDRHLEERLRTLYDEAFPTTQSIVRAHQQHLRICGSEHRLRHIETPYDFDGRFNGDCIGQPVLSTKGRALNYALSRVAAQTEMIGFYDAESRPEFDVLLYVAWRRLEEGKSLKLLQGPVFQVRNFYEMGPLSRLAGLYQSIAHDWYLPVLFEQIPFLGGTNVFVDHILMRELQGFDCQVLTEDLELGARAWLHSGAWPEYLPYYSSEQTPPNIGGYFRQRLRWGAGHLQVMEKLKKSPEYKESRTRAIYWRLFVKGQLEWLFFQLGSLVPLGVAFAQWLGQIEQEAPPHGMTLFFHLLTLCYLGFTFYAFDRYRPIIDRSSRPRTLIGQLWIWGSLVTLPVATFFFTVPYTTAWIRKMLRHEQRLWVKTPRSQE